MDSQQAPPFKKRRFRAESVDRDKECAPTPVAQEGETPGTLEQLRQALELIPREQKVAYTEALKVVPEIVDSESNPVWFLRCHAGPLAFFLRNILPNRLKAFLQINRLSVHVDVGDPPTDLCRELQAHSLSPSGLPESVGGKWKYDQYLNWVLGDSPEWASGPPEAGMNSSAEAQLGVTSTQLQAPKKKTTQTTVRIAKPAPRNSIRTLKPKPRIYTITGLTSFRQWWHGVVLISRTLLKCCRTERKPHTLKPRSVHRN